MAHTAHIKKTLSSQGLSAPEEPRSPEEREAYLEHLLDGYEAMVISGTKFRWKLKSDIEESDIIVIHERRNEVHSRKSSKTPELTLDEQQKRDHLRAKNKFMNRDPLVRQVRKSAESQEAYEHSMIRLSEIASQLAFERQQAVGKEASLIARREMSALTALRDGVLKRMDQRLRSDEIDIESLAFRNIFLFIIETFQQALKSCKVTDREIQQILNELSKAVDSEEWRAQAFKVANGSVASLH